MSKIKDDLVNHPIDFMAGALLTIGNGTVDGVKLGAYTGATWMGQTELAGNIWSSMQRDQDNANEKIGKNFDPSAISSGSMLGNAMMLAEGVTGLKSFKPSNFKTALSLSKSESSLMDTGTGMSFDDVLKNFNRFNSEADDVAGFKGINLENTGVTKNSIKALENGANSKTLFHYTNEEGMNGIVESKQLNPSLKANNPKDARYGDGQYLSDIIPTSQTPSQLAKKFINVPNKYKYTSYIEIDVTGLKVSKGREGVFVILNDNPLDLTERIVNTGKVGGK